MEPVALSHDAAQAAARVLEGAVTLAKAEARLAMSELSQSLARAAIAAGILWAASAATFVAIALICVSPLLAASWDAGRVVLSIALSACLGGALGAVGVWRMRAVFAKKEKSNAEG